MLRGQYDWPTSLDPLAEAHTWSGSSSRPQHIGALVWGRVCKLRVGCQLASAWWAQHLQHGAGALAPPSPELDPDKRGARELRAAAYAVAAQGQVLHSSAGQPLQAQPARCTGQRAQTRAGRWRSLSCLLGQCYVPGLICLADLLLCMPLCQCSQRAARA